MTPHRHLVFGALLYFALANPARAQDERSEIRWTLPGLAAPAEILVDRWGVPHLYASSLDDLFFVQGLNAARDRLWQLDLWKRRGEGRLAEALGPDYVEQDRAARLFLYRRDLYPEWLAYGDDTKRVVTAFVAGINAYIALTETHPELLPPEFGWLDYRPLRWEPETVVRIRSHGLLRNVRGEARRARLLRDVPPDLLALSERLEPEHALAVPDGFHPRLFPDRVLEVYDLGTGAVDFAPRGEISAVLRESPESRDRAGADASLGSNNWAVAPSRTATGRPLLADDPHRATTAPSLRYIVHLSSPQLDAIGAGEPALPGISIGHNGTIAFGLTIFGIDQEDLYVYRTNPARPREVRYQGRWVPMEVVREVIAVRGGEPVPVELLFTRHGPVLYEDPQNHRAYGLRAAWLEPGMAPYLGGIALMRARSWDAFVGVMNRWGAPSENQVYADIAGNIGWKPGGRTPIRDGWDGLLPVPGDGRYEWAGFRDMDALPVELNPDRGFVATANEMNLPPGYPHPTGYEWTAPYRYQRIAEVLAANPDLTVAESVALQNDVLSIPARRLLAVLAGLGTSGQPRLERALGLLRSWDARLTRESAAAALFEVWFRGPLPAAVLERLVPDPEHRRALSLDEELLLRELERPGPRWGESPEATRDEVIRASLLVAASTLEGHLGSAWEKWAWGDLHVVHLRHPLSGLVDAGGLELDFGPAARGGSAETVGNTAYNASFEQRSGASFKMVVDVGAWDESVAMNAPGQSGDPRSPHYGDLFSPWVAGEVFPLLYSRVRVEQATVLRIILSPSARAPR